MNVISAVEDHRRGYRREKGSPKRCLTPQAVGHEGQEQDQADAKEDRNEPEPALGELIEVLRRPRQTAKDEGGVRERRSVMFVGIVLIATVVPELAELNTVYGLVIVHRALAQSH